MRIPWQRHPHGDRTDTLPSALPADRDQVVSAARTLYARHGFAQTSHREIASRVGTTPEQVRALFATDADLFAAVYHQVQDEVGALVAAAYTGPDPLELMRAGLGAWIEACHDPEVRRVLVLDPPTALGWERWRREGDAYGRVLIDAVLADAMDQGLIAEQPVRPLSFVLAGALESGCQFAAHDPDPGTALAQVRVSLESLLDGLVRTGQAVTTDTAP